MSARQLRVLLAVLAVGVVALVGLVVAIAIEDTADLGEPAAPSIFGSQ